MTLGSSSCIRVTTSTGQSIHILVNDPDENGNGLFIPLEHLDTYESDPTVVVADGHRWIRTPMSADFLNANVWPVKEVEMALASPNSGVSQHAKETHCADDLLLKLRHGVFQTQKISARNYRYARGVLGDDYLSPLPKEDDDPYWGE